MLKMCSVIAGRYRFHVLESMDLSLFTENNPYGFALNVNHPQVEKWYKRFKAEKKLPEIYPISDELREEFETRIFSALHISYETVLNEAG